MIAALLSLALAAQNPPSPAPQPPPLRDEAPPARQLSPAHDLFDEDFGHSSVEARVAIHGFGACVANRSPGDATEILRRDFTTRSYSSGLRRLGRNNEDCFRRRGRMRSSNLLFAGAIAETLVERAVEPVNVRLARAAQGPPTPAFSPSDRVAICVVRSVPDDVSRLFETEVGSDSEARAAQGLGLALAHCSQDGLRVESTPAGLRAILATAAFRTVTASASAEEGSE